MCSALSQPARPEAQSSFQAYMSSTCDIELTLSEKEEPVLISRKSESSAAHSGATS